MGHEIYQVFPSLDDMPTDRRSGEARAIVSAVFTAINAGKPVSVVEYCHTDGETELGRTIVIDLGKHTHGQITMKG